MSLDDDDAWVQRVLTFWFEEIEPKAWFTRDAAFDERVRTRFLDLHQALAERLDLEAMLASPERALASVIVLDQLPRNMFRGTPRAFATDPLALAVARGAVGRVLDRQVSEARRMFLYLPFEHSESREDQQRSVELFTALGDAEVLRYAIAHKDIIDRFGRFPHRNEILGRISTAEEIAFLATPGSSF